ncbi:MAG TPA: TrmH family RNA methyltransferase [Bryobacteraceae bacterium]|nr:TrmH family RNA methyltransferase [Bryobacteraceae bacterium]
MRSTERIPYLATQAAAPYDGLRTLPVSVLLHNVRSLYNTGAFFRTMDAAGCDKLYLTGITGRPPHAGLAKTALGSEETVAWEHHGDPAVLIQQLREQGAEIAAIETSVHALDLYDWQPCFPVCVLFGHEVDGLADPLLDLCDTHVRIPMLGRKHSLNVATAGGVVIYELLRKYRALAERSGVRR